jgi:transcription antitermination factor NusG
MSLEWYALRSKPNMEAALSREASARGFDVYFPQSRVHPVNPRARRIKPYFPGYMFVQTDLRAVGPSAFAWMPYSRGLVSFGSEPAPVPDRLIHAIRQRVEEFNRAGGEGFTDREKHANGFKAGDRVIVKDGLFAGYQAIFDAHLAGVDRVRVLLELLRARPIKVDLSAEQIQPTNRR